MQGDYRTEHYEEHQNIVPFIPDGEFYFTKGVEAFQKRKFDIAAKWLQKAIDTAPMNPLYKCQMSIVHTEIGAYHEANQLLTEVMQSSGDYYADCYYLLANNYAHLGLLSDAQKYAQLYLDKKPDGDFYDDAKHLLDLMDFNEEDDDAGDDEWEFDEEDDLLIYQETVFYHMENQEWDKALPLLEEMLMQFPEHQLMKHDYTHALFFSGNRDDAVAMEKDLLAEQPYSLHSHINLAVFYYEMGRSEAYESHIKALLNVYPIHEQQKLRVAVTFARTGLYSQAYPRFKALAKGQVNHLSYYKWYSVTSYQLGEVSKARSLWQEGCHKYPSLAENNAPWE